MGRRTLSASAARIRTAVFADLQSRIDRLAASGQSLIPLHIGDTCLPPPEAARRVLADLDPEDPELHRYAQTGGLAPLREAIADILAKRGRPIDPGAEVLVGNGGTHALYCAARAVLDEGDEVLMAAPYWPLAPGVFQACGARPVEASLTQLLYQDPEADPTAPFRAALTSRTRALYIISPNNPDGKVLTPHQLERIAAFAVEHDLWVFSDEVYADVTYGSDRAVAPSIADALGPADDRTIRLHSLSKSHALAGLRVGFAIAAPAVVTSGRRVSTHTAFNVSLAMQRAALAALSDRDFPRNAADVYRLARDRVADALTGAPVRFALAEGATYLFLDFGPAIAGAAARGERMEARPMVSILERAVDRGVLLAPGDAFGADYAAFARLCFTSAPLDDVLAGVARLRDALDAYVEGRP